MWLNQQLTKSEPRAAACTAFIENLGGARMRGARAGANAPLLGGFKWLPWGQPFAMHQAGGWKHNVGIQVLWDLTTVARQPGETAASALKPSHMYSYNNLWECGLEWVTDYGTLIKLSIWHQFMTKYYQYMTICIEIKWQTW